MDKQKNSRPINRLLENKLLESFLLFSAFRAVYGFVILLITWLMATKGELRIEASIAFLIFSMFISRKIFKSIKKRR